MTILQADDAADKNELVSQTSDPREAFADLDTGHTGGDRPEFPTDFGRGFRFDVPHVLMRGTTAEENVDQPFMASAGKRVLSRFRSEQIPQRPVNTSKRKRPNRQERSAADTIAEAGCTDGNVQHTVGPPSGRLVSTKKRETGGLDSGGMQAVYGSVHGGVTN
jgi:hypothetical protein